VSDQTGTAPAFNGIGWTWVTKTYVYLAGPDGMYWVKTFSVPDRPFFEEWAFAYVDPTQARGATVMIFQQYFDMNYDIHPGAGLWVSRDSGFSWARVDANWNDGRAVHVTPHPLGWIASTFNTAYISTNDGMSWDLIWTSTNGGSGMPGAPEIYFHVEDGQAFCQVRGVLYCSDDLRTWTATSITSGAWPPNGYASTATVSRPWVEKTIRSATGAGGGAFTPARGSF